MLIIDCSSDVCSSDLVFEASRAQIEADNAARRATAQTSSKDAEGKQVVLIRQASNAGHLYGSVSVRDIVEALHADGVSVVTKSMVVLERPIKTQGLFDVRIALHPEVAVTVQVNVDRSSTVEHTSDIQSLMRISYAVFCLKKKTN